MDYTERVVQVFGQDGSFTLCGPLPKSLVDIVMCLSCTGRATNGVQGLQFDLGQC